MGQYTGISNTSENVQNSAMSVARVDDNLYHKQRLNQKL